MQNPPQLKVIILGETGVGKSSLVRKISEDDFACDIAQPTIGIDMVLIKRTNISYFIWDTAGQERFRSITNGYFRGVHLILLCVDVEKPKTVENAFSYWIPTIKEQMKYVQHYVVAFVICKKDIIREKKLQIPANIKEQASLMGFSLWETSAKEDSREDLLYKLDVLSTEYLVLKGTPLQFESSLVPKNDRKENLTGAPTSGGCC
jgi:small GTP-binding protein